MSRDKQPQPRILIADDEPSIRVSLEFLMRREGYDVQAVGDGNAALQAIASFRPDLLLLDLMLPGLSGLEVSRAIRAQPGGDRIRIVLVTAKGASRLALTSEDGIDQTVTKPFATQELVAAVRRLLFPD